MHASYSKKLNSRVCLRRARTQAITFSFATSRHEKSLEATFLAWTHRLWLLALWRARSLTLDSRGFLLLESIVAVAIFAAVGTAVMLGVQTAHLTGNKVEEHSTAERLARNQMEYVFTQPYQAVLGQAYVSLEDAPPDQFTIPVGYGVTAVAAEYVPNDSYQGSVQKVVVTVSLAGNSILVLESLRAGN